ncbi:MAG: hypothetical protein HRF43_04800 [Phycisphaerae bacterium]|jgi:endonuclease III
MKHGSEYAKQIRRLWRQMLRQFGKPRVPEPTDPIEQLILGILGACTSDHKAAAVYRRLREHTVDLNELRVTPAMELAELIGPGLPLAREKARRIVDALNAIRRRQDKLDLSFLQQRGRREAREYLESLEGVDKSAAASVVLFSLGGHAIPVDDLILYVLRQEGAVDPGADIAEVQGFLERTIPAAEAAEFSILLSRYAAGKVRVPVERLRSLLHPPPPPAPVTEKPVAPKNGKPESARDGRQDKEKDAAVRHERAERPGKPDGAGRPGKASAAQPAPAAKQAAAHARARKK